ncbi:hypothetical protein [Methanococcus vannielii]|uniref:hypothetical protein n=1 Tax=Methanococcus vannielii TaxID=2187 RepID=UPI0003253AF9|nr:hypothetical protein [Methanococcus vannielii]
MNEGDFLEAENGVFYLILRKFRNGDFVALANNCSGPERFSSYDVKTYKIIDKMENKTLNLLRKVMGVKA